MPSADDIRLSAATITNEWRWLALGWHMVLAIAIVSVMAGWRPSARLAAGAITTPLVSVSILAWLAGNPFNGLVFAVMSLMLLTIAIRLANKPPASPSQSDMLYGIGFVAFGWIYPHFLLTESPLNYLYESPFGLIPCPTLLVVTGLSIIVSAFNSRSWLATVGILSLVYGMIGVLLLKVTIDLLLVAAAIVLMWRGSSPAAAAARISA